MRYRQPFVRQQLQGAPPRVLRNSEAGLWRWVSYGPSS